MILVVEALRRWKAVWPDAIREGTGEYSSDVCGGEDVLSVGDVKEMALDEGPSVVRLRHRERGESAVVDYLSAVRVGSGVALSGLWFEGRSGC